MLVEGSRRLRPAVALLGIELLGGDLVRTVPAHEEDDAFFVACGGVVPHILIVVPFPYCPAAKSPLLRCDYPQRTGVIAPETEG